MGALAWVEVLDRRGQVRSRQRIDALPALIGRSYGCDILLDDPWISPIHVRVYRDLDGSFKVEDAGSENGLWSPGRPGRVSLLPLGNGLTLRAGRTTFRIVPADATVAPALAAHASAPAEGGWEQGWVAATTGVIAGGLYGLLQLLGDADTHRASQVIGDALTMVLALGLWSGGWALATRAIWHRARFLAHFTVAAAAAVAMMAVMAAVEYAAFIAPGVPGFEGAVVLLSFAVATGLLYGHLTIATALSRGSVAAISTGIVFGLAVLGALVGDSGSSHRGSMPEFSAELKPLRTGIIPAQDTTDFFAGLKELKVSVDSLARDPD